MQHHAVLWSSTLSCSALCSVAQLCAGLDVTVGYRIALYVVLRLGAAGFQASLVALAELSNSLMGYNVQECCLYHKPSLVAI